MEESSRVMEQLRTMIEGGQKPGTAQCATDPKKILLVVDGRDPYVHDIAEKLKHKFNSDQHGEYDLVIVSREVLQDAISADGIAEPSVDLLSIINRELGEMTLIDEVNQFSFIPEPGMWRKGKKDIPRGERIPHLTRAGYDKRRKG